MTIIGAQYEKMDAAYFRHLVVALSVLILVRLFFPATATDHRSRNSGGGIAVGEDGMLFSLSAGKTNIDQIQLK
ncbi:hypothetical protein A8B75_18090 [Sphingomonadales bacterium EhC05]|nr:hypothetical protein A8B75_18090 [Sphingomonadales bacterium EhC05]